MAVLFCNLIVVFLLKLYINIGFFLKRQIVVLVYRENSCPLPYPSLTSIPLSKRRYFPLFYRFTSLFPGTHFHSVVGRIMAPKDVHVRIPGTCEYVRLCSRRGVKIDSGITAANQFTLK